MKTTNNQSHIFKSIINIVTIPFKVIGSKNWSIPGTAVRLPFIFFKRALYGSDRPLKDDLFNRCGHMKKRSITQVQLKEYLPYACSTAYAHGLNPVWINSFGFTPLSPDTIESNFPSLQKNEYCYFEPNLGLKVVVLEKDDEVIISFGALRSHFTEIDDPSYQKKLTIKGYTTALRNLTGDIPEIYNLADSFVAKLRKDPKFKSKKITLTGQCAGGSIASYVSINQGVPSFCLNTVPLGVGLQHKLGKKKLEQADQFVNHILIEDDVVSDFQEIEFIDKAVSKFGLRTPFNPGNRLTLPSAYKSIKETHDYAIGSIMQHLGYDKRTKPDEIPPAA